MEELGLTAEQLQALTAAAELVESVEVGGDQQSVQLAYLSEDGTTAELLHQVADEQHQQVFIEQQQPEQPQQIIVQEEPQQFVVHQTEDSQQQIFVVNQQEQVVEAPQGPLLEGGQNHQVIQVQADENVDLQSLIQSGIINPESLAALTGEQQQHVVIHQEEQQQQLQPEETVIIQEQVQEDYLVQCVKCDRTFDTLSFEKHFQEVHQEAPATEETKSCSVCGLDVPKKDFLAHFKTNHSDVRLGCPKCPQTYHSPELLNVHYKHFHQKEEAEDGIVLAIATEEPGVQISETPEISGSAKKSRLASGLSSDLLKDVESFQPSQSLQLPSSSSRKRRAPKVNSIFCDVCLKTYNTQRDFTNHKRRKGFCKPPPKAPAPQTRRIGIIRKSL